MAVLPSLSSPRQLVTTRMGREEGKRKDWKPSFRPRCWTREFAVIILPTSMAKYNRHTSFNLKIAVYHACTSIRIWCSVYLTNLSFFRQTGTKHLSLATRTLSTSSHALLVVHRTSAKQNLPCSTVLESMHGQTRGAVRQNIKILKRSDNLLKPAFQESLAIKEQKQALNNGIKSWLGLRLG